MPLSPKWTEERISNKLRDINLSVPENLRKNLLREVKLTPMVEKVVEAALADPNFPPEKKERLKVLKESGEFTKTKMVENPQIAKMIDNYVNRKINEAIKKGELPPKSQIKYFPWLKKQS